MDFLKKHYEKIILSVVLAGLAVVAALLPLKVSSVSQDLETTTRIIGKSKTGPVKPIDLSTNEAVLRRVRSTRPVVMAEEGHNVFNPIRWVKGPRGQAMPQEDTVSALVTVTNIAPLRTEIIYVEPRDSGSTVRYQFRMRQESSTNSSWRSFFLRAVGVGDRPNELFQLKEVQGPKANPTNLIVQLTVGSKQTVSVTKEAPYSEVAGYAADLQVETRTLRDQRQGQKVMIANVPYNIVAISPTDVTLEDSQTKKRTTIRWKGAQ